MYDPFKANCYEIVKFYRYLEEHCVDDSFIEPLTVFWGVYSILMEFGNISLKFRCLKGFFFIYVPIYFVGMQMDEN